MLELITDRTQQDVDRVKALTQKGWKNMTAVERAEWDMVVQKGAYNYEDLNRVENAVADLASRLIAKGFNIEEPVTRKWTNTDIPTAFDMRRYLYNVRMIRDSGITFSSAPPAIPDTMENLTYAGANAIEQLLAEVDRLLTHLER